MQTSSAGLPLRTRRSGTSHLGRTRAQKRLS